MEDYDEITPDKERSVSLIEMVRTRLEAAKLLEREDRERFSSKLIEEYYESMLELVTAMMSLDGFKTRTDLPGFHINTINYMRRYKEIEPQEIELMQDLRKKRIGIKYYGRQVRKEFMEKRGDEILSLITRLIGMVEKRLDMI